MQVIRLNDIEKITHAKGIQVRNVISQKEVAVVNVVLQPGEILPMHSTPVDVFFYVHEGKGTIVIGEEQQTVKRGEIVISPREIPHGLLANAGEEFSILVVKTPNPKV